MEKEALYPGGLKVSPLIWGAMRIHDSETVNTASKLASLIDHIASLGITSIDMADIYGNYDAEEALGHALKDARVPRDQLQIITKCGIRLPSQNQPDCTLTHYDFSAAYLRRQVDRSLEKLQVEQIDLLLLHRPDYLMNVEELVPFLDEVISSGKAAYIGVSNFTTHQLELLQVSFNGQLQTNQIEISPYHEKVLDDGTLEQAQRLKMRPMAWSPLKGLTPGHEQDNKASRLRETLLRIAQRYDAHEPSIIALAWIYKLPSKPLPIIGSTRVDRIASALKALNIQLTNEEWYEILIASRGEGMP